MKIFAIAILALAFSFASCGNGRNGSNGNSENMKAGIIVDKSSDDGCGFVIKTEIDGAEKLFDPGVDALDEKFRVDGMKIEFGFEMSRRSTTCPGTQPIMITSIKKK